MELEKLMEELLETIEKYISKDEKISDKTIAEDIVKYLVKIYDL